MSPIEGARQGRAQFNGHVLDESDMSVLRALLVEATGGNGRLVAVCGEAGVGNSVTR
ncbi:MAG: hypothetical protein ACOYBY_02725 [Dermatophilaceae bacterium]